MIGKNVKNGKNNNKIQITLLLSSHLFRSTIMINNNKNNSVTIQYTWEDDREREK